MRKIKNIKQLQTEKKRIKKEQEALEQNIRENWSELKECLRPANITGDALNSIIKNKTAKNLEGDNILKNTFTYGITLFAQRLADKAGDRFDKLFKRK